ncbi:MAG TPA: efflux RND transporter periplasmic adaptor subunit [Lacunisphaera sp.]|nr:efflux RND transporter periplasmic adaptor subunit [Lacunisphaera sp.]
MSIRSAFFVLAVVLLAAVGCRRAPSETVREAVPALPVRVAVVTAGSVPLLVEAPATVRPAERASLAPKLTGTVASFPLGLGAAVHAGEVLVTLNVPEVDARARQAQAQLAEAERNADRARTLVGKGVNPPDSLKEAEDRLRYAQAQVAEAEAMLAYANVRAPFDGVITEKNVLPGDLATPGVPLLVLEATQRLRAEGAVPEKAAAGLHPGDSVQVLLQDGAPAIAARIEEISAAADAVSRSVLVKAALPAGAARSGQFARLQVANGSAKALWVPASAVTLFGQMERVFVVHDGSAGLRLVKTGGTRGEQVEILSGLNPGEQVVLAPPAALRDGQPVSILP